MLKSLRAVPILDEIEPDIATIREIQKGDKQMREALIERYTPFASRLVVQQMGRWDDGDGFSAALLALNEAIDSYQEGKGTTFKTFATTVMKRRLIDYTRQKSKRKRELPFSSFVSGNDTSSEPYDCWICDDINDPSENMEMRDEISKLVQCFKSYHLSFSDLLQAAPKHLDTRKLAIRISIQLANDHTLYSSMIKKHRLPLTKLARLSGVNCKTIMRHKTYILLIALIWNSDLEIMRAYVKDSLKGGQLHE